MRRIESGDPTNCLIGELGEQLAGLMVGHDIETPACLGNIVVSAIEACSTAPEARISSSTPRHERVILVRTGRRSTGPLAIPGRPVSTICR